MILVLNVQMQYKQDTSDVQSAYNRLYMYMYMYYEIVIVYVFGDRKEIKGIVKGTREKEGVFKKLF